MYQKVMPSTDPNVSTIEDMLGYAVGVFGNIERYHIFVYICAAGPPICYCKDDLLMFAG